MKNISHASSLRPTKAPEIHTPKQKNLRVWEWAVFLFLYVFFPINSFVGVGEEMPKKEPIQALSFIHQNLDVIHTRLKEASDSYAPLSESEVNSALLETEVLVSYAKLHDLLDKELLAKEEHILDAGEKNLRWRHVNRISPRLGAPSYPSPPTATLPFFSHETDPACVEEDIARQIKIKHPDLSIHFIRLILQLKNRDTFSESLSKNDTLYLSYYFLTPNLSLSKINP